MMIKNLTFYVILPLVINLILTPIIISFAHKKKLFDATDHRKTHTGNIPRLGGIGFFIAFFISVLIIYLITKNHVSIAFYIATAIIFISGLTDDLKPIRALYKLIAQIIATLILIIAGHSISHVFIPFVGINLFLGIFQYPITFLWIIGITNAINLLDGMDGQAGGVSTIAIITFGITSLITGNIEIAITCFILAGSLIGFLHYNLPPAKIFMGDCGSLTVGFFLAAIPLIYTSPETKGKMILVGIAVLLIPILDVFSAIIRRTKLKISFFEPDRGHIHHKFTDFTSLSTKQILIVIYSIATISGIISILFIFKANILSQVSLFINLLIHILLFSFLHKRKVKNQKL